jgi:hypothetical protein
MIDLQELKKAIKGMTRQQAIYKLLKHELGLQGHWKNHKRGKPNPDFIRR